MAEHIRTTIRTALKSQLSAALPDLNIYANRMRPIGIGGAGQAVEILTPGETRTRTGGDIEYEREITGLLIGYCAGLNDDSSADGADLLELRLETAVHGDTTLGGAVQDIWLTDTSSALDASAYANASFALSWRALVNISLADMNSA